MNKVGLFFLLALVFTGCKSENCGDEQDISDINLSVKIESLENELFQMTDTSQLNLFLEKHPIIAREFFSDLSYPSKAVMLDEVYKLIKNPFTDTLYQQVKAIYGNGEVIQEQFTDAFKRIKYYYPEFKTPKIQTVVTGFGNDVYLSDSLIVIGLDYYLGEQGKYKPDLFQYILDRMTPDHLVPSIVMFMSNGFNKSNMGQRTMVDEMVFFGKAYHFTKKVMPCTPDNLIAGYTQKELLDSEVSEEYIWSYFIQNEMLYDKNTMNITKFVNERPSIPEIDPNCPGRIGRWLGWQIVQQYAENNGNDLVALMNTANAKDILMRSKYKPQSR
jgi:gliding motility-associated lipoprotein GldB